MSLLLERLAKHEEGEFQADVMETRGWEYESLHCRGAVQCTESKPRIANQAATCNPAQLLDKASHLNLSLMRWQLYPSLRLELIKGTRCLVLGAGTLGCAAGRALLSWGFGKITFIDSGYVSYSNPTRQCLFDLQDCLAVGPDPDLANGDGVGVGVGAGAESKKEMREQQRGREGTMPGRGRSKAHAAAEALIRINPNIQASGAVIEIPYPGIAGDIKRRDKANKAIAPPIHESYYGESMNTSSGPSPYTHKAHTDITIAQDLKRGHTELKTAIDEHDIVFNLLDSREARWLPTLLCSALNKTMLTGAVGFDSYLVMRHGRGPMSVVLPTSSPPTTTPSGDSDSGSGSSGKTLVSARLGCYFCSDLTSGAGGTAYEDRPLDQQCSVTRPGLSGMVGGLCAELAVEIVQQQGQDSKSSGGGGGGGGGGGLPHQIRGSLTTWTQECLTVPATDTCVACSRNVVSRYLGLDVAPPPKEQSDSNNKTRYHMPQSTGADFVVEVCRDTTGQKLEQAAGVSDLIAQAERRMADILLTDESKEQEQE